MPRTKLDLPLVSVELICFNCNDFFSVTTLPKLFCSDKCQQEARFVRYFRNCRLTGKLQQQDIRLGLNIKMSHILNGGYKQSERRIPASIRRAVYERDKARCRKCGKVAKDIDHIKGNSYEMENLQVLCRDCHNTKTTSHFVEFTPETDGFDEKKAKIESLRVRTEYKKPLLICDDEANWKANQKIILAELRQDLHNERFLEYMSNQGYDITNLRIQFDSTKNLWMDKIIGY